MPGLGNRTFGDPVRYALTPLHCRPRTLRGLSARPIAS
jgi:hypothetical protein